MKFLDTFGKRGTLMYYSPEGLHGVVRDMDGREYYFIMKHEAHLIGLDEYLPKIVEFDVVFNHELKVYIAQNVERVESEQEKK